MIGPGPQQRGIALIEALAAVALVSLAVLIACNLLAAHPRAVDRLQAQQQMLSAVEATLETVRSGGELRSGPAAITVPGRAAVRVSLEVTAIEPRGLFLVTARARCTVRGQELTRKLETMVWRPS